MYYSKFQLEYFRSYREKQSLKLAVPNSNLEGSGITYLVGENNSGKTTVIEAIFMHSDQRIRSSEKQNEGSPCFELYNTDGQLVRKLSLVRPNSYTLVEDPIIENSDSFEIIPSRRHWNSQLSGSGSIQGILNSTIKAQPRSPIERQRTIHSR